MQCKILLINCSFNPTSSFLLYCSKKKNPAVVAELNGKFEDYIKSETFSGTTDSTSNIHVSSNPNRIYIAAQPNIGQRILFPFRYLENRTYIRVLTNAGAAAPNTAISGTAWYIDLT